MKTRITILIAVVAMVCLMAPAPSAAQNAQNVRLDAVAKALGASGVKSLEITGDGFTYAIGQSAVPGVPWPKFNMKDYVRTVNYEAAASSEVLLRSRAEARGGGLPAVGEVKQQLFVAGDQAWNVVGDNAVAAPIALAERQFQLWATPHGIVKGAALYDGTIKGRTISFAVPGRFRLTATVDGKNLIQKVDGVIPNPVLGDLRMEIEYSDYKDFGGVKFPMKITQTGGGMPALDMTVTGVKVNPAAEIVAPDPVRQATSPYTRVTTQSVADGVWYVTGGTHHSVVIAMADHAIVVEAPLNDERALTVLAAARTLVGAKPIKYVVVSHHHFDHSGGVRAFGAEGVTVVTHETARPFFERALAARATVAPDHMAKANRKATVEGFRDKHVLSDATRTVEIHSIAGNQHADDILMVYLPKEKLLIQSDVFTPVAPNAQYPSTINPNTVHFAETIQKLGFSVEQHLPLHGRVVPFEELNKAIGRGN